MFFVRIPRPLFCLDTETPRYIIDTRATICRSLILAITDQFVHVAIRILMCLLPGGEFVSNRVAVSLSPLFIRAADEREPIKSISTEERVGVN